MKSKRLVSIALALVAGATWIGTVVASRSPGEQQLSAPRTSVAGEIEILESHPFVLDRPAVHEWRKEKPTYTAGVLLVLRVPPELATPRQTYESVLYVGDQTAERCYGDVPSEGNLVVIVPSTLDAQGRVALDLEQTPIWFGTPELPERVDAARIRSERLQANRLGIGPATLSPRARALRVNQDAIRAASIDELQGYIDELLAR